MTDIAQTFGMSLSFFRHDYHVHLTFLAGLKYRAKTLLAILSRVTRERKRGRGGKNSARDCAECAESASRVHREWRSTNLEQKVPRKSSARYRRAFYRFSHGLYSFAARNVSIRLAMAEGGRSHFAKEKLRRGRSVAVVEHMYGTTSGVERGIIHRPFVGRTTGI